MRLLIALIGLLAALPSNARGIWGLDSFLVADDTGLEVAARHGPIPLVPEGSKALKWRASMVHNNPGEGLTKTKYSDPEVIRDLGFNVMVKNDGRPPHTAITWDSFDDEIFPNGTDGRAWVEQRASEIDEELKAIHRSGMKAMYWSDVFVLPKSLIKKYGSMLKDDQGRWSLDSPEMIAITKYMFDAVFERFPDLDGLVIRTGEIYTQDVPFHRGRSPITNGPESHVQLLKILEEVVIHKHKKMVFYRTWSFDGFHTDPYYYRQVTDAIKPNKRLIMVIKHTAGDFWRTLPFNPTLGIGSHPFMVEVQCQREYEGKGAIPNYVMKGVIDGFDENLLDDGPKSLRDLRGNDHFQGVLAWPRGGGWHGPYPANELWIDMNVEILARWAQRPNEKEEDLFFYWVQHKLGLDYESARNLREIALLSARGTLLGHYSLDHQIMNLPWTRDFFIGGVDAALKADFNAIINEGLVDAVLSEKALAVYLWEMLPGPARNVHFKSPKLRDFVDNSIGYAILLYTIIWRSWIVQLKGLEGDRTGNHDLEAMQIGIEAYDLALSRYMALSGEANATGMVSSLYTPFQYRNTDPDPVFGVNHSVNLWRWVMENKTQVFREEL
jgi:hypothetical protein